MEKITVSLDIGGTEIKAAAIENGRLLTPAEHFPSRSKEPAEIILENMTEIIRKIGGEFGISRIASPFPGPSITKTGSVLSGALTNTKRCTK